MFKGEEALQIIVWIRALEIALRQALTGLHFPIALDAESDVAPDFARSFDAEAKLCDLLINGHDVAVMGT